MRALVVAAALLAAGCGNALVSLPAGAGEPVEAAAAQTAAVDATRTCAAVQTMTAEVAVSGSTGGRRLRARLAAGVSRPAAVRLEAVSSFGPPLFVFATPGPDATLFLEQDNRVLEHGAPAAVLDAVAGVAIDSADLVNVLTGCGTAAGVAGGRHFGDRWLVASSPDGLDLYLHRHNPSRAWQVAAIVRQGAGGSSGWRAELGARLLDMPEAIRLVSVDAGSGAGRGFDLRLDLSQIDVNPPLGREAFTVQVPRTAVPMTLDELRRSGPLNGR